jgi:hypothetical protein
MRGPVLLVGLIAALSTITIDGQEDTFYQQYMQAQEQVKFNL